MEIAKQFIYMGINLPTMSWRLWFLKNKFCLILKYIFKSENLKAFRISQLFDFFGIILDPFTLDFSTHNFEATN